MEFYVFDGTLEGLLTSIFEFYERKPIQVTLQSKQYFQPLLIGDYVEIVNNSVKAERVWKGLHKKIGEQGLRRFYKAFLSEQPHIFNDLFHYACYVFNNEIDVSKNYGHPLVMSIMKMDKSVNREKHRMEAFIRFQETADGIFYASIEPDFNVLPLISRFFKNRFADQQWIIYDVKRNYGLFYNLKTVEEIVLEQLPEVKINSTLTDELLNNKEQLYALLWNDYFKSTNIPARKNMKLHIKHVPKRYWKYLTEKNKI